MYCFILLCLFFFFFFQAEDGIRDDLVTGVQTCALPICGPFAPPGRWPRWPNGPRTIRSAKRRSGASMTPRRWRRWRARASIRTSRSEERRVGKECRSRGSADHYKEKLTEREERLEE